MDKPKVVVIGLDGSSWDLVKQLLSEGRLPNIKKMMASGMSSTMLSTHPAHSAPAWTTFATGLHPTQHGCFDFLVVNNDLTDLDIIDSTKITSETIYETMVRHGRTPILINLPNTFPPKLKTQTTITSLMTRGDRFIYPAQLLERYPNLKKYRLSPNAQLRSTNNFDPYIKDLCKLEADRIAAAKDLFSNEPWDFFFFLSSGTDWVSHVAYDKALREHYEPALAMWDLLDEFIGWIMKKMDDDTTLLVMSDHGFQVYDGIFYLNRWLEEHHYLATKTGNNSFQQTHTKLSREVAKVQNQRVQLKVGKTMRSFLKASPLFERTAKWFYHHIVKRFVPVNVTVDLTLDLDHSRVGFPRGSMASMLYINDAGRFQHGIVPASERQTLTDELRAALKGITDTAGHPVVESIATPQELYGSIDMLANSPDLFIASKRYYLSGSLHSAALFERSTKNYHDANGMFLAYGAQVDHRTMPTTDIINMAPTILHSLGLPVQQQYQGKVMDIFKSTSAMTNPAEPEQAAEQYALREVINELDI